MRLDFKKGETINKQAMDKVASDLKEKQDYDMTKIGGSIEQLKLKIDSEDYRRVKIEDDIRKIKEQMFKTQAQNEISERRFNNIQMDINQLRIISNKQDAMVTIPN